MDSIGYLSLTLGTLVEVILARTVWGTDSPDGIQAWRRFLPEKPVFILDAGVMGGSFDYLRESDWRSLQSLVDTGFSPSPAAEILGRAHGFLDSDEWKYALRFKRSRRYGMTSLKNR
jgi:hypothetical protein